LHIATAGAVLVMTERLLLVLQGTEELQAGLRFISMALISLYLFFLGYVLVSTGKSNKEIADLMCVSVSTARTHVYNMFQKTGVKSRVELLRLVSGFRE
jgi:hypothetical protein